MVQCEYLGRKFSLSSKAVKNLKAVELRTEIDYEEKKTAGGMPQVNIKGYKPQSIPLEYNCVTSAGVDPYEEYKAWKKKVGKGGEFYVGSDQFGVDIFVLKGVSMTGAKVNIKGRFVTGTISLSLTQDIVSTGGK